MLAGAVSTASERASRMRCRRANAFSPVHGRNHRRPRAVAALTPGRPHEVVQRGALDRLDRAEMLQQRALARRPDAGDLVERVLADLALALLARWRRWRSGAPRRAGAGRSRAPGSRARSMKGARPGMKNFSRPASRSGPLAMPTSDTSVDAELGQRLRAPHRAGPGRRRSARGRARREGSSAASGRRPRALAPPSASSLTRRAKRRCSTSRIMP